MTHAHLFAGLTVAVFVITGCCSQAQAAPTRGVCNSAAAEALTGKHRISDRRAKRLTGATLVRQIKPGRGVTMDYRSRAHHHRNRSTHAKDYPRVLRIMGRLIGKAEGLERVKGSNPRIQLGSQKILTCFERLF
jgi:hypothetical protein